jgi:hypothetical protein
MAITDNIKDSLAYSKLYGNWETTLGNCDPCVQREKEMRRVEMEKELESNMNRYLDHTLSSIHPINNLEKEKTMDLSLLSKVFLDGDTKALIKAGILNDDLTVSDDGINFLLEFVVSKFKAELAVEAKKIIKAQKDEE